MARTTEKPLQPSLWLYLLLITACKSLYSINFFGHSSPSSAASLVDAVRNAINDNSLDYSSQEPRTAPITIYNNPAPGTTPLSTTTTPSTTHTFPFIIIPLCSLATQEDC